MNEELIKTLAGSYERHKCSLDRITLDVIAEIHDKIAGEYDEIRNVVRFVDKELNDFDEVKADYVYNGTLLISSLNNKSDLLPGILNLWFRAWHDYIHLQYDYPFTFEGEYKTYLKQVEGLSYKAKQVLFSEIVLQTAYCVFYGTFAEKQKVVLIDIDLVNPKLD